MNNPTESRKRILITGGTGFVGSLVVDRFPDSIITSRNAQRAKTKFGEKVSQVIEWDYTKSPIVIPDDCSLDAVVNLAGESIAEGRWNEAKKKRIRDSRVVGTKQLVDAICGMPSPPSVVVSASAVGIYGSQAELELDENAKLASGYLPDICRDWEEVTQPLTECGIRVVLLRIGIVLGKGEGALGKLVPLFKLGLGGRLGDGKHYVPWIHVDDLVSMIEWSIHTPDVHGPLNGSAPNPVTNTEMTKAIAKTVRRLALFPAPKFALRMVLGEFADSLFSSQRVIPKKSIDMGFQFEYPNIEEALEEIINP